MSTDSKQTVEPDIAYRGISTTPDSCSHSMCRLDLYRPATSAPGGSPLLVWFHGGGLETGDKQEQRQITFARRMVAEGIAVASANYRLSPDATFPAYIEDAAQAVAWAVRNAPSLGCNPRALFVGGESAGGYLAAMLAMDSRFLAAAGTGEDHVAGFIPMCGQMMTHFTVRKERGCWNGLAIDADEAAPIHHIRASTRPLLILVADQDMPTRVEENRYFFAALTLIAGNRQARFHVISDRDHSSIFERCLEPGDPAGGLILDFIRASSSTAGGALSPV